VPDEFNGIELDGIEFTDEALLNRLAVEGMGASLARTLNGPGWTAAGIPDETGDGTFQPD
jgi:hypothetical protein